MPLRFAAFRTRPVACGPFGRCIVIPALSAIAFLDPAHLVAASPTARGEFRAWVEQYQERWGPYGEARRWDGATIFHLDGESTPVNAGVWTVSVNACDRQRNIHLAGSQIPTELGRLTLRLGDYAAGQSRRQLEGVFRPSVWFRGASLGVTRGETQLKIRAGVLTRRQGLFAKARTSTGVRAVGVDLIGAWRDHGGWQLRWDQQGSAPGCRGLQVLGISVGETPPQGWLWHGEFRLSRENGTGPTATSAAAGAEYTRPRLSVGAHLRRTGASFQETGVEIVSHRNELGGQLNARFRPRQRLALGGSVDWSRDLAPYGDGPPPESRLSSRLFLTSALVGQFHLLANAGYRMRSTRDPDSLLVDQGVVSGGGEIEWRTTRTTAGLGFSRRLLRDPTHEAGDWHESRYTARARHRFTDRLRARVEASHAQRRLPDGRWTSRERRIETRLMWRPRDADRVWLSLAREHQEADDERFARDQWQVGGGLERPLPAGFAISLEGTTSLRAGGRDAESARWHVRVARKISFGGGRLDPRQGLPEFGSVRGTVFEDTNANGLRDVGEPGVEGILLRLGSGPETTTDVTGEYEFSQAATNLEFVSLDVSRLPARYLAPRENRFPLRLEPGDEAALDFPVKRAARLVGRVVMRTPDGSLAGVPNALVRIAGSHHDVFTDSEGRYQISDLEAGTVRLEILEWSLPEDARLPAPAALDAVLRAGAVTTCGDFVLERVETPVMQFFRPDGR